MLGSAGCGEDTENKCIFLRNKYCEKYHKKLNIHYSGEVIRLKECESDADKDIFQKLMQRRNHK